MGLEELGGLESLRSLTINSKMMTFEWLKGLKELNELVLIGCWVDDKRSVSCICELDNLKRLVIYEYHHLFSDDVAMMSVLNKMSELETLMISSPIRLNLDLSGMKGLKVLNLRLLSDWSGLDSFGGMKELKELILSSRTTNDELRKLGEVGLEKLEVLNVSDCNIDDDVMGYIGNMRMLRTLNLNGCVKITDAGMDKLRGLMRLKELNAKGCVNITDVGIRSLDGLGLERFEFANCPLVKIRDKNGKN